MFIFEDTGQKSALGIGGGGIFARGGDGINRGIIPLGAEGQNDSLALCTREHKRVARSLFIRIVLTVRLHGSFEKARVGNDRNRANLFEIGENIFVNRS